MSKKAEKIDEVEDTANTKPGPNIELDIEGEPVLLRPYTYGWELCWTRKVKDRDNEGQYIMAWQGEKFFSNIASAMQALFEYKLRATEATTLYQLCKNVADIKEELVSIFKVKGIK